MVTKKQNNKKSVVEIILNNKEDKVTKKDNYGLFKYIGGLLIITAILTWIFKANVNGETQFLRIGLLDFFTMVVIGFQFYAVKISFLLILGGFYQILSVNKGYKTIVSNIVKILKGNEKLFIIATTLLFSVLAAIVTNPFILLIFVPFFISIIIGLKHDNLTAFLATFGGILVGTIGNIFSSTNFGFFLTENSGITGVTYGSGIEYRIALFAFSYILLTIFSLLHMKKKNEKELINNDMFESSEVSGSEKKWPVIVILIFLTIITLLAYLPWEAFGATWQTGFNTWFNNLAIGGESIFQYLVGYAPEFGSWDLVIIQSVLLVVSLLVAKLSKLSLKDIITEFGSGFKKMIKPVALVVLISAIPLIPLNIQFFQPLFTKIMPTFNYLLTPLIVFISSIFGVEMEYAWVFGGSNIVSTFAGSYNSGILATIYQSVYGFVQFFAPTSIFLVIGLSYLDIPYTTWLKKSWKYLLGLLVAVITVVLLITQL